MHHYKDTKEGVIEVCASIESYANDRALDEAITMCLKYCPSKDQLIDDAIEQFPSIPKETVISRVSFLWNQKESE